MPIYELECVDCHNKVEKLFTSIINFLTEDEYNRKIKAEREERASKKFVGFDIIDTTPKEEPNIRCEYCNGVLVILPSLYAPQPDNMWHFGNTGLGNFSSKKEYNTYIKNNNLERATRENYESAQKKQANRFETVAKKNKENLTKFIEKELAGVEVSPDGNTVKEKNKYNKVRD